MPKMVSPTLGSIKIIIIKFRIVMLLIDNMTSVEYGK
jgi:hypothetical protein